MCVLIRVTEYIHNVLKTFLPLVTRPCRFDQITRGKIKPRTEGFINHVLMAAILIFNFDFHRTSSPGSSRQIEKPEDPGGEVEECKNSCGVGT